MKSRGNTAFLLDTSFLLPTLGINVETSVLDALREVVSMRAELYYSGFSVLECLWIMARIAKTMPVNMNRVEIGLRAIMRGGRYYRVDERPKDFIEAFKLYNLGHRDMIDNILYATALNRNLKLLTTDKELKMFIKQKQLKDIVILPKQL